jgi:alkane 1-monooxygenase
MYAPISTAKGLRWSDTRFLLAWLLPLLTLVSAWVQPAQAAWGTLVVWLLVVSADLLIPGRRSPLPVAAPHTPMRWLLRLYVPLQLAMLAVGAWVAHRHQDLALALGLALSMGFVCGAQGITYAHELGHSRSRVDRFMGWVLMVCVGYGHFMVEHYRGHHPRAATHDDPASARRGESLWRFMPRTLVGSWRSAWQLEGLRLQQHRRTWWQSPLVWATTTSGAVVVLWGVVLSPIAALFWILQGLVAIWLLETVNYIEHYGLQRGTSESGVREPFGLFHAWNADHLLTNSMLANLQRHSDHHMHAWKPFETLQALPGPQLPTGYAGCLFLAAVPPLWFGLMHPRLDALRAHTAAPAC